MKKRKLLNNILIVMTLAIAFIIGRDFIVNRGGKHIENPYAFDIREYTVVDPAEIIYREVKALQLPVAEPKGIACHAGMFYVIADSNLLIINIEGQLLRQIGLDDSPTALAVHEHIWLAFKNRLICLNQNGDVLDRWGDYGPRSVITSLAVSGNYVYIADAGNRVIYQCTHKGDLVQRIGEKDEQKSVPGFIIPSPYFDIALSEDGFLWAVDPGRHSLLNFNPDASLRTSWARSSVKTEGFSGCCNPSHMFVMNDNSFITSEKGIVRVKIYDQHGTYRGVVATPDMFDASSPAPDVCADEEGRVFLLDFSRKQLRIFEPKTDER